MATETQKLIRNVLDTGYEAFNQEVIRDAKRQLIDLIGVMVRRCRRPYPWPSMSVPAVKTSSAL
jgi:hypothetical protein